MPRFFITPDAVSEKSVTITGDDAFHIGHVLRMTVGEKLTVCDTDAVEYFCEISGFTKDEVRLSVISSQKSENEPSVSVTLYQGLPKADKFEQIIQKAVELGVGSIVPVCAKRCVVKVGDGFDKKLARYNAISLSGAKQSGRGKVPRVESPIGFDELIARLSKHSLGFICYEGSDAVPICDVLNSAFKKGITDVGFYIGPEGGVDGEEVKKASAAGITLAGLGNRILRTETASGCVLSVIMALSGNL